MAVDINLNNVQAEPIVVSTNTTAVNNKIYHVVANTTFTDPTPVEGKGFVVYVRNGTAVIGGTSYVAGSYVLRVYHSGAWGNKIISSGAYILPNIDGSASQVLQTNGSGVVSWATVGGGLTIGTTPITSGTVGRILFEGSGNVVQEDSALFWDNTNKRLGVGATPSTSVRLDVRAQGALSTDVAFRVRNSADTLDILTGRGNGTLWANGAGGSIYNTCFGEEALDANTTGIFNSAFGWQALTSVTTGNFNTAFGLQALRAVVSGSGNTAFGDEAGETITGSENVAVGRYAMQAGAGGNYNTCIGGSSGLNISTGEYNFFGGFGCGANAVITGAHNIGIGSQGLTNLTSGGYNIGIGYLAGGNVSTGTYNTFLGANAGLGITTGAKNTFIGNVSGLAASTANNVIIADGDGNRLIRKDANHNQILGVETALATNATDGFTYIPTCAGTPTGTPTAITGKVPIVADTTNNKLYVYLGGAWTAMN